jgi:hypothetical protein
MIEEQTASCAAMYRLVRDFALKSKPWSTAIRYHTRPDERHDLTLVSQRVYGRRDEFLTIMAAAGLDSVEQILPEQLLTLPTDATLTAFKERSRFANVRRR